MLGTFTRHAAVVSITFLLAAVLEACSQIGLPTLVIGSFIQSWWDYSGAKYVPRHRLWCKLLWLDARCGRDDGAGLDERRLGLHRLGNEIRICWEE